MERDGDRWRERERERERKREEAPSYLHQLGQTTKVAFPVQRKAACGLVHGYEVVLDF